MIRGITAFALFLCLAQAVMPGACTTGVALGGVSAQADDPAGTGPSATTLANLVVRDTFDDNVAGAMWDVLATDPNCRIREVNRRLELQASNLTTDASAGFVSKGWRLDPRRDFSMKVDWYFDADDRAGSSISFGVVADAKNPWERNAVVGVGYKSLFPHYCYRSQDGYAIDTSMSQRGPTSGQLFMSYNAADDELYVGFGGYGAQSAWMTFPGLLKETWGGKPVYLWLAGDSSGATVASGRAYLDNLIVETGFVIEAALKDVHRFWCPLLGEHFYTISQAEKELVVTGYKDIWQYQGVIYRAFADNSDPDTRPVHRFWSNQVPGHFYTLSTDEYNWLITEYPHMWIYEGVAFYAYPDGKQPATARPVYRFSSRSQGSHFYTANDTERKNLQAQPQEWTDEGIAWYAMP